MVDGVIAIREAVLGVRYATDIAGPWQIALAVIPGSPSAHADWSAPVYKRMTAWLTEQYGSSYFRNWAMHKGVVYFRHREDAVLFKLTWHGQALPHADN